MNFDSIYRGYVVENVDATKTGKVKVIVPIISDSPLINWATPRSGKYGESTGILFIPDKGAKVFVEFENGRIDYPVYSPGEWDDYAGYSIGRVSEFVYDDNGKPIAKVIKTKAGILKFKELKDEEEIALEVDEINKQTSKRETIFSKLSLSKIISTLKKYKNNKVMSEVNLSDNDFEIILNDENEQKAIISATKDELKVDLAGKGKITINATGIKLNTDTNVIIDAGDNANISATNATIDASANLNVNAGVNANISATNITVDANALVTVNSPVINLKGTTTINNAGPGLPGFCALPNCLFTGVPHTLPTVGTP